MVVVVCSSSISWFDILYEILRYFSAHLGCKKWTFLSDRIIFPFSHGKKKKKKKLGRVLLMVVLVAFLLFFSILCKHFPFVFIVLFMWTFRTENTNIKSIATIKVTKARVSTSQRTCDWCEGWKCSGDNKNKLEFTIEIYNINKCKSEIHSFQVPLGSYNHNLQLVII